MREDMAKVIVERPRLINSNSYDADGRKFRNSEDAPMRLGMQRGYNFPKHFNENLAPLKRFLEKQVNRPWNKVYAEIRAQIDGRSTIQQHILQHLENFVAIHSIWDQANQQVLLVGPYADVSPLHESRMKMYVHPKTGLLRKNPHPFSYSQRNRLRLTAMKKDQEKHLRFIDSRSQLRKLNGIWYKVELAELPTQRVHSSTEEVGDIRRNPHLSVWDVVCKAWISLSKGHPLASDNICSKCGRQHLYAKSKRQLNAKELKEFNLVCD